MIRARPTRTDELPSPSDVPSPQLGVTDAEVVGELAGVPR